MGRKELEAEVKSVSTCWKQKYRDPKVENHFRGHLIIQWCHNHAIFFENFNI